VLPAALKDQPRWVTVEALNVAPDLVGAALGSPWRRAWAMGLDLLVVALLTGVSGLWLLVGLALVVLQLRSRGGLPSRMGKRALVGWVVAGVIALLAVEEAGSQWEAWRHPERAAERKARAANPLSDVSAALEKAAAETEATDASEGAETARQALRAAARAVAVRAAASDAAPTAETAASAPAEGASAAAAARRAAAADRVRIAQLEAELAEARRPKSWRAQFSRFLDDIGAGLGWGVVYFSLLPAWWGGQTVGKKLLRLRVVELTGKPMTVMRCLKRYGGYAAGLATGGLGLAQILWDVNRQGLQDKVAHTVVLGLP
jgi:uncharacterized RDD family membrane protein YckC